MNLSVLFKKLHDYITDKDYRVILKSHLGFYNRMGDREYLEMMFRTLLHQNLNLDNPRTFNEKLQWLKLYDRRPEYTTMVDKYEAKKYVSDIIGEEYIIPTLGVWEHFDDIDFEALPQQFVLKCTHDSGGLVICRDKSQFDRNAAKKQIEKCLKHNYFYYYREWPYKNVKPRIIAEKYMENPSDGELKDYKFYVFGGVVKAILVISGRGTDNVTGIYHDDSFKRLDFTWGYSSSEENAIKPFSFELMKMQAESLAGNLPEARVDFYEVDGHPYFGEITLYDGGGFEAFNPPEWDRIFGDWIKLPVGNVSESASEEKVR